MTLIERLNERAHDPARAIDEGDGYQDSSGRPVIFVAAPPATEAQVGAAEAELGFALPALLCRSYREVGNGGFGPGYGLLALTAGADASGADAGRSVVGRYAALRQGRAAPQWPTGLIPLCEWGCGIASYLDCSRPEAPVVRLDPNMAKADVAARVPVGMHFDRAAQVGDACWVEAASLEEWLTAWVDGGRLFYLGYGGGHDDSEDEDSEEEDAVGEAE